MFHDSILQYKQKKKDMAPQKCRRAFPHQGWLFSQAAYCPNQINLKGVMMACHRGAGIKKHPIFQIPLLRRLLYIYLLVFTYIFWR